MIKLTLHEFRLLKLAVNDAAALRGSMVGNPDPEPLRQFDARIEATREVLKKINPGRTK